MVDIRLSIMRKIVMELKKINRVRSIKPINVNKIKKNMNY
jgi:hypothetical protein